MFPQKSVKVSVGWCKLLNMCLITTDTRCRWGVGRRHLWQNVSNYHPSVAKCHFPRQQKWGVLKWKYPIKKMDKENFRNARLWHFDWQLPFFPTSVPIPYRRYVRSARQVQSPKVAGAKIRNGISVSREWHIRLPMPLHFCRLACLVAWIFVQQRYFIWHIICVLRLILCSILHFLPGGKNVILPVTLEWVKQHL